jgi:hypothetical protein
MPQRIIDISKEAGVRVAEICNSLHISRNECFEQLIMNFPLPQLLPDTLKFKLREDRKFMPYFLKAFRRKQMNFDSFGKTLGITGIWNATKFKNLIYRYDKDPYGCSDNTIDIIKVLIKFANDEDYQQGFHEGFNAKK